MANRHDLLIRLDSEFSDKGFRSAEQSAKVLERELAKQEAAERQLANLQMAAQREDEARRARQLSGMESVGRGFTAVGLLAAAGLGVASKAAIDWESAWAGVTKTVDGTPEQMAALERELRNLATTLPITHEEIAGVAEAAGQLGVKRQDIIGFTKTMVDLGVSTNLSADEAATAIAQITNVMGTMKREGTEGVSRFAATLVALGNAGASTEQDIVQMAARLAGAGKVAGLSEANVLALANTMSSLGIEAQLGGSAMSRVLLTINSAAIEGGDSIYKFAQVAGTSADAFAAKWKSSPAEAVDMLVKGLGRIDAQGGDVATTLRDLGLRGTENASVMLRLSGAGDLLTDSLELGNQAWEQNTALVDEANKRYETTESRLKIARNELNNAAIDIGANVLPAMAGAADRVGFLAESFHGLPEPVKEAVTMLGGFVGVAGTFGGAMMLLIPKVVELQNAFAAMGTKGQAMARGMSSIGTALTGPWGLALGGATIALGIWAEKQYEARARVEALSKEIDLQTGALSANGREMQAQQLKQQGYFELAQRAGISTRTLTEAASGQTDALKELERAQRSAQDAYAGSIKAQGLLGDSTVGLGEAAEKWGSQQGKATAQTKIQADTLTTLLGAVRPMHDEVASLTEEQRKIAEATGQTGEANKDAAGAAGALTGAFSEQGDTASLAAEEIDKLIKSIEGYGDTVNHALDAQSAYEAALDDAAAAFEKNGKTANKSRDALNLHTEAGRANDKALRNIATSALEAATANFQNGKSVKGVTGDVMKARGEFIEMAMKMNLSKSAANRLADQLGLTKGNVSGLSQAIRDTPTSHTTDMRVKTEAALERLRELQSRINGLRGNDVRVNVRYVTTGQTGGGITKDSAAGNLFEFSGSFAGGGYAPIGIQQPQIRLAGGDGLRWAEQGAGAWEAFISGNPAKRDRSLAIWEDAGRRLGAFESMASQPAVMVQGAKTIDRSIRVTAYGHSAQDVAREIRRDQAKFDALHPDFGG